MKERLLQIGERIDSMELRQRVLLLVAGLVLLFSVADTLALQPALKQQKVSKQAINDIELKLDILRQRSGLISDNTSGGSEYQRLLDTLTELEQRIEQKAGKLLAPDQAIKVLEQVLAEENGLTLNEVTATVIPAEETMDAEFNEEDPVALNRYRVSLQLEGSYLATLRYLRALEQLPWTFYWEGIEYEVTEHPMAQITLNIYTLGYPRETAL